jgi:glutathione synthase/RimK-type ligase-like ATP-grasp enzyme
LSANGYHYVPGRFDLRADEPVAISDSWAARGWIRRLSPPDWLRGVEVESRESVHKAAWMSLLAGIVRTLGVEWLTQLDSLVGTENKLVQVAAARRLGLRTPATLVTSDLERARTEVGETVVIKPVGPSQFFSNSEARVIFAQECALSDLEPSLFAGAPFLVQESIDADWHVRAVTVQDKVWFCRLAANGLPLDWRRSREAHGGFEVWKGSRALETQVRDLAAELQIGFSSQDWILGPAGEVVLDVNPAGQWLFLPEPVSTEITGAIADFLGRCA